MREEQREFFNIMDSFRRLNFSSMLPEISHGDFGILKMINQCVKYCKDATESIRVSDIVRHTKMPPPAVSRSLRTLEEKEYIVRTVDKIDRRNTYVELTSKGEEVLKKAETVMSDFADEVFGQMGDETIRKMNRYLRQFLETSQREIEKRKNKGKGETYKNGESI